MEDYIQADPCQYDHHQLFCTLQSLTLKYRLQDPYCSLVSVIALVHGIPAVSSTQTRSLSLIVQKQDTPLESIMNFTQGKYLKEDIYLSGIFLVYSSS